MDCSWAWSCVVLGCAVPYFGASTKVVVKKSGHVIIIVV